MMMMMPKGIYTKIHVAYCFMIRFMEEEAIYDVNN
jgi:hypothetical protein